MKQLMHSFDKWLVKQTNHQGKNIIKKKEGTKLVYSIQIAKDFKMSITNGQHR